MDKLQIYTVFIAVISGVIGGLIAGSLDDYDSKFVAFLALSVYLALLIPIFGRVWGW
jgi:hypothetical protein